MCPSQAASGHGNTTGGINMGLIGFEKIEKPTAEECFAQGSNACNEKKYEQAFALFLQAAEQGHAKAQFLCGLMYNNGEGTAMDSAKALYWFKQSAQHGYAEAQIIRGLMCDNNKDFNAALRWYKKAAEQGQAEAQFICGCKFYRGEGTVIDHVKALRWYEKAAEQDHADAQFYCGTMYLNGEGTAVDKDKARHWFEKAAEQTEEEQIQQKAQEILREQF